MYMLTALLQFIQLVSASMESPERSFNDCVVRIDSPTSGNRLYEDFDFLLVDSNNHNTSFTSNLGLFQRRFGDDCSSSLYIKVLNQCTIPPFVNNLHLIIRPKKAESFISRVYSIFSNESRDVCDKTDDVDCQFVLELPNKPCVEDIILFFVELGISNDVSFEERNPTETCARFCSDIFVSNPVVVCYNPFLSAAPADYTLPTNQMISLLAIFKCMKKAFHCKMVCERDIKKIETAIAINEIRSLFCKSRCCKPVCKPNICYDYAKFVTSCIQVISYCKDKKVCPKPLDCVKPYECSCDGMNKKIIDTCKCLPSVNVECKVDICTMFEEVFPCYNPCATSVPCYAPCGSPVPCGSSEPCYTPCGVPCGPTADEYVCPCESMSVAIEVSADVIVGVPLTDDMMLEDMMMMTEEDQKKAAMSKRRTKKKATKKQTRKSRSSPSYSTYGWYAAGGVVVVSIAVVVYIFVL